MRDVRIMKVRVQIKLRGRGNQKGDEMKERKEKKNTGERKNETGIAEG